MKDLGIAIKQSLDDPSKARKVLSFDKEPVRMTVVEALASKIDCDFSDQQHQMLRNASLRQNADIYPPLYKLLEAKAKCHPSEIEISEIHARVPLQFMLNHILDRVLITVADDIPQMGVNAKGILYVKLGMDGASSQSNYNQKYDEADLAERSSNEDSLFLTSITPLRLVINSKEVWSNPKPSSPHFTRPLHMQYEKENVELTVREEQCLRVKIDSLTDINFKFGSISFNAAPT